MYYNYIRIVKDLYAMLDNPENREFESTIRIMLDETMFHFVEAHAVPFERREEFLTTMFYDCPQAIADYKIKKFEYVS